MVSKGFVKSVTALSRLSTVSHRVSPGFIEPRRSKLLHRQHFEISHSSQRGLDFALFVVRASSTCYRQMDRKRSSRELPEGSPVTRRMRLDTQNPNVTPFLTFPSPPPRTSSALSDPVRPTTIFEGLEDSNDFNFDPLAFLESLSNSPIPPSSTSYTRPHTYQADYESLPTDFQVLGNPYLTAMPSPPLVPADQRLGLIGGEATPHSQPVSLPTLSILF